MATIAFTRISNSLVKMVRDGATSYWPTQMIPSISGTTITYKNTGNINYEFQFLTTDTITAEGNSVTGTAVQIVDALGAAIFFLASGSGSAATVESQGALINSATAKTTPVDADQIGLMDSAASNVLKKLSWANLKAGIKTYYDSAGLANDYEETRALIAFGSALKFRTFAATVQSSTTANDMVDGSNRLLGVHIDRDATITGVAFKIITAGVFTADNQNRVGLYSLNTSTGDMTLVASSANDAAGALWKTAGTIKVAFSSPYVAAAGPYYISLIYNNSAQTTAPALLGPAEVANRPFDLDLSNSIKMWSARTVATLESPITQAQVAATNRVYLAFLY